jgi:hypothetical protein
MLTGRSTIWKQSRGSNVNRIIDYTNGSRADDILERVYKVRDWLATKFEITLDDLIFKEYDLDSQKEELRSVYEFAESFGWQLPDEHKAFANELAYINHYSYGDEFFVAQIAYETDNWDDFIVIDIKDTAVAVEFKLVFEWENQ